MSHDYTFRRIVVTGRVQGVGFRLFVAREAGRLKLTGWVRNRAANQVECVVSGEASAISELAALADKVRRERVSITFTYRTLTLRPWLSAMTVAMEWLSRLAFETCFTAFAAGGYASVVGPK